MDPLIKFILSGLLFAAFTGEIVNQLIVHNSVKGFLVTMVNYSVLLAFGYGIGKFFKKRVFSTVLYGILFGIIGLIIEYIVLNQGAEAFAFGMFTFWAFLFLVPRIFVDASEYSKDIKRIFLNYTFISGSIVLLLFLIPNSIGRYMGIIGLMIQIMGLYIPFLIYLKRLYANDEE